MLQWLNPLYSPILFSVTAEDHLTVERALGGIASQTVMCIGSAGDTALNLLLLNPARVDVVDISFSQLCLATLKAEGMRRLPLADFRLLLGLGPTRDGHSESYFAVRPYLPTAVAAFWDANRVVLERGIISNGGLQRWIACVRAMLRLVWGSAALGELAAVSCPEQADAFVSKYVRTWRFKVAWVLLVNRLTLRLFYPKAAMRRLGSGRSLRRLAARRLRRTLRTRAVAGNPCLFPLLFGRYPSDDCVPPYLSAEHYEAIRTRVPRLNFVHQDVRSYLCSAAADSLDGMALCNAADWMSDDDLRELLTAVVHAAREGARVLLLSRRARIRVPSALQHTLIYDRETSEALAHADRTGYYLTTGVFHVRKC